ncbi:hypothetical protein RMCBS344292_14292 [Rhizopus microsporus]|nr:hypothetical protein RMCBS344292_14292 [Rhizopus microsporus]
MIGYPHLCGGTLLSYSPAFVLTAAHCVADADHHPSDYSKEQNPYFVSYRDVHRHRQRMAGIADWIVHPLYNVSSTINPSYDVAIVKLDSTLRPSRRVRRAPLWSPEITQLSSTQGEFVGFGYTDLDGSQAKVLQKLVLNITRFDNTSNIEAKTDTDEQIACHGDSGSPLITRQPMTDPKDKSQTIHVSFVLGNLVRIYGARDVKAPTCPVPDRENNMTSSVTESFANVASVLDWISQVSGISTHNLTDPWYEPPCPNCQEMTDDEQQTDRSAKKWNIGVVADENGLISDDTMWIGAVMPDYKLLLDDQENSFGNRPRPSLTLGFLLLLSLFTFFISIA